jgi:MraZ protein
MGMQGSYSHKLDSKGRMVLPARFRDGLGDRVVATIGIGGWHCVSVYPVEQWQAYLSRLDEVAAKGGKARDIRRIILASAHELDVDGAGRILIPSPLRTYAAIGQEVSVNGNSDHIEIWNMSTWGEYMDTMLDDIGELTEGIEGI